MKNIINWNSILHKIRGVYILFILLFFSINISISSQNIIDTCELIKLYTINKHITSVDTSLVSASMLIPQKTKWPAWTYYDKNTKINGISAGFISGTLFEENVTTNGLKFEAVGMGFFVPFALVYSIFAFPEMIKNHSSGSDIYTDFDSLSIKNKMMKTNGVNFSTLGSFPDNVIVNGFAFGGFIDKIYVSNGLSVSGLSNTHGTTNGVQLTGISAYAHSTNGFQFSTIYSHSSLVKGVQMGIITNTKLKIQGVQLGAVNLTSEANGLQLGIFNKTNKLKGIQIGLWNKNGKRSFPIINWGF